MMRWLSGLVLACVVLAALGHWRGRASATPDAGRGALERLVPDETRATGSTDGADTKRTIAALSIESSTASGRGTSLLYARSKGRWRLREANGAFVEEDAFKSFLSDLLDARGLLLADDPARESAYGLDPAHRVTIGLHGTKVLEAPDRDRFVELELGSSASDDRAGAGGPGRRARCFARRAGETRILELDRDLRGALGSLGSDALPPFVDTHLLAGSTDAGVLGLKRIAIARRGAPELVLSLAAPRADDPSPRADEQEGRWTLRHDGVEQECPPWRAGGCMGAFLRGRAVGFTSAANARDLGLEAPLARIEITPDSGPDIEFVLSDPELDGSAWLWNRRTNLVMRVGPGMSTLLAPDVSMFTDVARPNPWERFLSNRAPGKQR